MRRRDRVLLLRLLVLVLLLLALAHIADAPPDAAAALRVAGGHQLQDLLRALLARPEPAKAAV